MFKRLRRLRVSLAAKCQLLFGFAAALIIAAALFVPWQRMEQLTYQLDRAAAETVAQAAVARHPEAWKPNTLVLADPYPIMSDGATTGRNRFPPARIVPRDQLLRDGPDDFEAGSFDRFANPQDRRRFHGRLYDDGARYRYARPLFINEAGDLQLVPLAGELSRGNQELVPPEQLFGIVAVDIPSQVSREQLLVNRAFVLTAGLLAGTLAVVTLYLIITRLILKPVRVLQETAEKVAEGDLNIRSDISSGDEFQQLSETFNAMLYNLTRSTEQLRAVNKSLDNRLGQLADANVALYESNRLKSEFLANVSHELRTPLNSIIGFADLLKESTSPDAKVQRYVQNIVASGNNLLDLINDLLDLAKIEAGRMQIRVEPISIGDLFEGLANVLKPLAARRNVEIRSRVFPSVPVVRTDPSKLQQVLYNFLSNAIKFSPKGETISLEAAREDENTVRITVTDRGPGIAPELHEAIFEKFRQLDSGHTREHSGTGLGLAISKELGRLLGGQIGVDSKAGRGATFWIILPLQISGGEKTLHPAHVVMG
ncbi:MAG: ATP-binding protein [Phycisphaerae bacterium]